MQNTSDTTKLNHDLVTILVNAGEQLTESVRGEIIDRGSDVIPELIAILEKTSPADTDAPGEGYVPVHAVAILKKLKAVESIEPMLRLLSRCDATGILYCDLIFALVSFGSQVLEPALKAYESADEDQRSAIAEVLSDIHIRDSRIYSILLEQLQQIKFLGACNLSSYGDPAALPHLSTALDECKVDYTDQSFANSEISELAAAIKELGGVLSFHQTTLLRAAKGARANPSRAAFSLHSVSLPLS